MGFLKSNVATGLAAGMGLAQGVVWSNMAIICIVLYNAHPYTSPRKGTAAMRSDGSELTSFLIWRYILNTEEDHPFGTKATYNFDGGVFTGFVWVHAILHIVWLIVSVCILTKMGEKKRMAQIWCVITVIIFIWDFVTSCIIMDDHVTCMKPYNKAYDALKKFYGKNDFSEVDEQRLAQMKSSCNREMLIVLTLTSKIFFILWIINIYLAYELWTSYGPKIDIFEH